MAMFLDILFVLGAAVLTCVSGQSTITLNGQWVVCNRNNSYNVTGTVPGSMYTALMDSKIIGDPYYRKNDLEYRWVGLEDWSYSRTFTVTADLLQYNTIMLVCEGLDTVSTVFINNKSVGASDNMFVRYSFSIKQYLQVGMNDVRVNFTSAVRYAKERANSHSYPIPPEKKPSCQHAENHANMIRKEQCSFAWDWGPSFPTQGIWWVGQNNITVQFQSAVEYSLSRALAYPYIIPPECDVPQYHGTCHVNMIRKMQCSFSWDWGPSFPTQGIWKDIYIQAYNSAVIRDVTSETIQNIDGSWKLVVEVFSEVKSSGSVSGKMEVKLDGTSVTQSTPVTLSTSNNRTRFEIKIPLSAQIKEWWPNGYGNQSLYDLYAFFTDNNGQMSTKKIRMGFRTVELVQDYVSANKSMGRTFYFRINGQPVFLKGSNWIPADSFPERATRDRVYNYLKSAADVHMNAMRVWGGGVYESDMFYEITDELGIMIWQDFMFGCSMYPVDTPFLESVKQEVTHQVRRLKHHPSIIILSGNNENEKALRGNWYNTDINFPRYKSDYIKLYIDTIYSTLKQEDTSRPFIASSPSNGMESEAEGWVAKDPGSALYGDIHYYNYLIPFFDPSEYRIPRMGSEYGLQSLPSYETLEAVYEESDMDFWGDLSEWRQHHPFGNVEMMAEAIQYLKLPNCSDRKQRFKDQIYVTQINQAVGMKTETEHYRRWQNRLDGQGQGNTMGALYWMLADIWQAPTWASLEYGGKWKMLHYLARHFFSPTLISPYLDNNDVDVYIVMDELKIKESRRTGEYNLHFQPRSNPRPFNVFDLSTYDSQHDTQLGQGQTSHSANADFSGSLHIEMYSWDNMTALHEWTVPFQINSTAQSVFKRGVGSMRQEAGCIRNANCFLYFHFGDPVNGETNWLPLTPFVNAQGLQTATVQVVDVKPGATTDEFTVSITTNAIAPFVWLEAYGVKGRFSDNGFLMIKPTMTLTFYAWQTVDPTTLKQSLTVKSLMDIYYD